MIVFTALLVIIFAGVLAAADLGWGWEYWALLMLFALAVNVRSLFR